MTKPSEFGIDNSDVLDEATQLAPDLFAALYLCARVAPTYPLASQAELEELLAQVVDDDDTIQWHQYRIRLSDARHLFPTEFLPVTDNRDLVRKVYLSILKVHETQSRRVRQRLRSGELKFTPSHPLAEEA